MTIHKISPSGKDDTAAILAAYNAASWLDIIDFEPGNYFTAPLVLLDKAVHLRGRNAILNLTAKASTCLTVGFSSKSTIAGGSEGYGWGIEGLCIQHNGSIEPTLGNQSIGLVYQNIYGGRVSDLSINGFGVGLSLIADGCGCPYNEFRIRNMMFNGTSLRARVINSGYANENTFYGGNWTTGPYGSAQPWGHLDLHGIGSSSWERCSFQIGNAPVATWGSIADCHDLTWTTCRWESLQKLPLSLDAKCTRCRRVNPTCDYVDWRDATDHMTANENRPNW